MSQSYRLVLRAPDPGSEPLESGSIQFIGTATILIRHAGFSILTDPNFLHNGETIHMGYGMFSATRRTDPAMEIEELPPLDLVVLSHMHESHFDRIAAERLDKRVPIATTGDASRSLERKGFRCLYALRTWDQLDVIKRDVSLCVTATPGRHGSLLMNALLPGVMGSLLDFHLPGGIRGARMYISGDTLFHSDLKKIPDKFPGIDIALLHLGGTRIMGILLTMDGRQGLEVMRILAPKVTIPIHYNDYDVFRSPLDDFTRAVADAGLEHKVRYLSHGETFRFSVQQFRGLHA